MSNYTAEFEPFYTNGWENQPSENTPIMGEALDEYDSTLVKIEEFLSNLDLSGLGNDYALLTEAGYSLNLSVDKNYVLTIDLLNKAGAVLSSKNVDLPLETMFINATYANGVITLTLQNGNTLDVDISDIVRGLVPTSRTIAGIDLEDDVTKEELQNALEIYDSTVMGGELKPWLYDTDKEVEIGVYNGKPLYRQVYVYEEVSVVNGQAYETIDVENPEEIYIENAYAVAPDGVIWPIPYAHSNAVNNIGVFISSDYKGLNFRFGTTHEGIVIRACVILNYTKTTDAEGSGNNLNPYGIYSAKLDEVKADIEKANSDIEELQNAIVTTDSTTLANSHAGRVLFNEIVGGMEQKNTVAKNKLECTFLTEQTQYGITLTPIFAEEDNEEGYPVGVLKYLVANGTATDNPVFDVGTYNYTEGETIILNGCPEGGGWSTYMLYSNVAEVHDKGSGVSYTATKAFADEIKIIIYKDVTLDNVKFYPMISAEGGDYEPYGIVDSPSTDYPQPINGSVIEKVRTWGTKGLLNPATCFNGLINTTTNMIDTTASWITSDFMEVTGGTRVSVSANCKVVRFMQYDENMNRIKYDGNIIGVNDETYAPWTNIMKNSCRYIRVSFGVGTAMTPIELFENYSIQIEVGEPTELVPIQSKEIALSQPITLYNDVLGENVERKYNVEVLNGSEAWQLVDSDKKVYALRTMPNAIANTNQKCSHYIHSSEYTDKTFKVEGDTLFIRDTDFATVDDLKTWLTEKTPLVVYELAESVIEELPTVDKIALNSLPTYDGITYVEFIDVGVQPTVSIDYGTSKVGGMTLESLLTARNNDLRLSSLEASVVNNI